MDEPPQKNYLKLQVTLWLIVMCCIVEISCAAIVVGTSCRVTHGSSNVRVIFSVTNMQI